MKPPRLFALLTLLVLPGAGAALAQEPGSESGEPARAPASALPLPPLVEAPEEPRPSRNEPPAPTDLGARDTSGTPAPDEAPSSRRPSVTAEALPRAEPARDPVPRVAVELVGGATGGVVGATALGLAGYLVGAATVGCDTGECDVVAVVGAFAGGVIGISVGTYSGGRLMGGQGRLMSTTMGSLVGWGGTLVGALMLDNQNSGLSPGATAALLLLPVVGATVGYELSHASVQHDTDVRAARGLRVLPVAGFTARGPRLGLAGRF